MAIATETVTIRGHKYLISRFPASTGRKVLALSSALLGPAIGEALANSKGDLKAMFSGALDIPPAAIGKAIQDLALRMNEPDLTALCEAFGAVTRVVVGDAAHDLDLKYQDTHFAGAYREMLEWLLVAWRHNFADFFGSKPSLNA